MPQKRNLISSELMLAAAKAVVLHAGLMVDAMIQDFRAPRVRARRMGWRHAESFILTAGTLHQAKFALGGLIVDTDRRCSNLGISKGLIVAEAVMMGFGPGDRAPAGARRGPRRLPHGQRERRHAGRGAVSAADGHTGTSTAQRSTA